MPSTDPQAYNVVFALEPGGLPTEPIIWFMLAGAALIIIGWMIGYKAHPESNPGKVRFFSMGIGVGCFVIALALHWLQSRHDRLVNFMETGKTEVVEGVVENFHPMPVGGHDSERFSVQGTPFAYSDYEVTQAFNNTTSHGGPIRAGLPVRITYVSANSGNYIVKIETRGVSSPWQEPSLGR